jgi:hypothetical protein
MPTPDELAIDLHDMWFAANSCRDMGDAHSAASTSVTGCSPASAFTRPEGIGYGATGIYDEWAALRDQIVSMLTTNASSLQDTATAMDICVEIYTTEDAAVKTAFDNRKAEIPYE